MSDKHYQLFPLHIPPHYLIFVLFTFLLLITLAITLYLNIRNTQELHKNSIDKERKSFEILLNSKDQVLTKLSRELHDEVGSRLFGIKLLMQNDDPNFFKECPAHVLEWNKLINSELDQLSFEVRNLSHEYAPFIQDFYSLEKALLNYITRINAKNEINCSLHFDKITAARLEATLAIEIYRIITELLQNSLEYGYTKNASVHIYSATKSTMIKVKEERQGTPSDAEKEALEKGLNNIHTRVQLSAGTIQSTTEKNSGITEILIKIPNPAETNEQTE